ncbi:MAG: hypothetical protein HC861_06740 [Rhodospirillaceae bacterium]|nr:hypothetical protein [Rhodospirillaceae bacterium]
MISKVERGQNEEAQRLLRNSEAALKQAATQFEAVFVRALLKSMRDALPGDPLSSDAGRMYTGMYDEQMAQKLSERGLNLGGRGVARQGGDVDHLPVGGAGDLDHDGSGA